MGHSAAVLLLIGISFICRVSCQSSLQKKFDICERTGWVFLPGVQQESWQAIMNCNYYMQPWNRCDDNPFCMGFTSDGSTGNGFLYRLPPIKSCSLDLKNLQKLEWEWAWKWVPMKCKDRGLCCGTYIVNDAGAGAAWDLNCRPAPPGSTSSTGPTCPFSFIDSCGGSGKCQCPKLDRTHGYTDLSEYDAECKKQQQRGSSGRRLTAALSGQLAGPMEASRALLAAPGEGSLGRSHSYAISKSRSPVPSSQQRAFVREAGTGECTAVARVCGNLA